MSVVMVEWTMIEFYPECECSLMTVTGWPTDEAGNQANLTIRIKGIEDDGFTSMTLDQAEAFAKAILSTVAELRGAAG